MNEQPMFFGCVYVQRTNHFPPFRCTLPTTTNNKLGLVPMADDDDGDVTLASSPPFLFFPWLLSPSSHSLSLLPLFVHFFPAPCPLLAEVTMNPSCTTVPSRSVCFPCHFPLFSLFSRLAMCPSSALPCFSSFLCFCPRSAACLRVTFLHLSLSLFPPARPSVLPLEALGAPLCSREAPIWFPL